MKPLYLLGFLFLAGNGWAADGNWYVFGSTDGKKYVSNNSHSISEFIPLSDFVSHGRFCAIYGHGYKLQTIHPQFCIYCGISRYDDPNASNIRDHKPW